MSVVNRSDLSLPKYDEVRALIRRFRDRGMDWSDIRYANQGSEDGLASFLKRAIEEHFWPSEMDVELWNALVQSEMEGEQKQKQLQEQHYDAWLFDSSLDNGVTVPTHARSSWQLYRKHLLTVRRFSLDSVNNIEKATIGILRRLSIDTRQTGPIKGLVIGQVQSGKTANMAALMAMAADWGWNFFIVLSGTIENLRVQTHERLLEDLNHPGGNLKWIHLNHLNPRSPRGERAQDLRLEEDSMLRYFSVCLKNSSRLSNLIEWMRQDPKKMQQMKILLIDDEADNASVNTADISENERKRINDLIVRLVEGLPLDGRPCGDVRAMNYISYTATPYANFLNESSHESLYPRHFIWALPTSDEYFGPKQIFGYKDENESDGLDVVRFVLPEDKAIIGDIHLGETNSIPESLKDAFCWFLCSAAVRRHWGHTEPISMLIHTSRKQEHHKYMAEALQMWVRSQSSDELIQRCRSVWERETQRFTIESFELAYPGYRLIDELRSYPLFDQLEPLVREIGSAMTYIYLSDDDELQYHRHVHLCIDNCAHNGITDDGEHVRLAYPQKELDFAPAFVVIGGSTLSRGLTIEGLVSTYFTRDVKQADSLMQMGRWFGYRRGYEMLPRIWLTEELFDKFVFLTELDVELRKDLFDFMRAGVDPSEYGPRVKNTPKPSWLRVTAANKMQSAIEVDIDFTGTNTQTISFPNNREILEKNIAITEAFLNALGQPELSEWGSALVWRSVSFAAIASELLERFSFGKHNRVFNEIEAFSKWVESVTESRGLNAWNVIAAGVGPVDCTSRSLEKTWKLNHHAIGKVSRTRKVTPSAKKDVINIGVLGAPRDLLADIPKTKLSDEDLEQLRSSTSRSVYQDIRKKAGLDKTPQLIVYRIDKDSTITQIAKAGQREDLNAEADIIGLWIHIPSSTESSRYARKLTIRLDKSMRDTDFDLMEEW